LHTLRDQAQQNGHVCLPVRVLGAKAAELLGLPPERIEAAVAPLVEEGVLVRRDDSVYLPALHGDELLIAKQLKLLIGHGARPGWPDYEGLVEDQCEALKQAVASPVSILTGAPGTGKTFTIKRIISSFPDAKVALAAPTGKAAKRMFEQTGHPASTIHKLLDPRPDGNGFEFERDAENPIEADLIVLDEMSMVDVWLMARFLVAVKPGTRLVLVGDTYQLPPVGPGNILKDLIASGAVPAVELTIIKRQDEGLIIRNCHRVKNGDDIELGNSTARDFFFLKRDDQPDIRDTVFDLCVNRLAVTYDADPLRDIQVITPLRERTMLSCKALNRVFQDRLNDNEPPDGCKFAVGDKVIQTRNRYDLDIMNGDLGYVTDVDMLELVISVEFENPSRHVDIPLFQNELELAYAITCHKFQGSEARIVVIPIHRCFGPLIMQRSWFYTAVSRAKDVCVLVGQRDEVRRIVRRNKQQRRFTRLAELVR
jgi:exodeoxyribonuclease V alpha subunit